MIDDLPECGYKSAKEAWESGYLAALVDMEEYALDSQSRQDPPPRVTRESGLAAHAQMVPHRNQRKPIQAVRRQGSAEVKPTKKQRAEAVLWLRCLASMATHDSEPSLWYCGPLALQAWRAVDPVYPIRAPVAGFEQAAGVNVDWDWREQYAEAAQLLEDGWCPGDDVEGV